VTTGTTKIKLLLLAVIVVFWPDRALAVQQHGGTEGLVAHQIGHILFLAGIVYLLYKIFRTNLNEPGWFEFKVFLWLIIGWNVLTFSGHWMRESVNPAGFSKVDGRTVSYAVNGVVDAYFYLTRLDHLLLVPAFIFLFLALRKWGDQS
jgi:hypothetical protein